jgi:hypothetical protein
MAETKRPLRRGACGGYFDIRDLAHILERAGPAENATLAGICVRCAGPLTQGRVTSVVVMMPAMVVIVVPAVMVVMPPMMMTVTPPIPVMVMMVMMTTMHLLHQAFLTG